MPILQKRFKVFTAAYEALLMLALGIEKMTEILKADSKNSQFGGNDGEV